MRKTKTKKTYLFQYCYSVFGDVEIKEDTELIALEEARELYKKYIDHFIERLEIGDRNVELVIWKDCKDNADYHDTLIHLDGDTEYVSGTFYRITRKKIDDSFLINGNRNN